MKRIIAIAALSACSGAFAVEAPKPAASAASDPFSRVDQVIARFNAVYAETELLIKNGAQALPPSPALSASAEKDLVAKDEAALAAWDAELSTKTAVLIKTKECLDTFKVGELVQSYKRGWKQADITAVGSMPFFSQLALLKAARALEAGNVSRCGGEGLFTEPFIAGKGQNEKTISEACQWLYGSMLRSKAVITKNSGLCVQSLDGDFDVKPEDRPNACGVLIANADRPKAAAAKLAAYMPFMRSAATQATLEQDVKMTAGLADEGTCDTFKGEMMAKEKCLASVRFKKAHDAGNASLCGSSGLCLAMMGGKNSSEVYVKEVSKLFCGRFAVNNSLILPVNAIPARLQQRTLLQSKLKRDSETLASRLASIKGLNIANPPEKQLQDAYMAKLKDLRWLIDEAMRILESAEPKSSNAFADRLERLDKLQVRFNQLQHRGSFKMKSKAASAQMKPNSNPPPDKP